MRQIVDVGRERMPCMEPVQEIQSEAIGLKKEEGVVNSGLKILGT